MNEPAAFDRRMIERLVVAIDGPSGAGKSTVARGVAARLGMRYLDTGAMYRALTWLAQREEMAVDDADALGRLVTGWRLDISTDPARPWVTVNGVDVTSAIRSAEVTGAVSAVSAVPAVRAALVARQREIVGGGGIVVEGRDIGTVVCPDAPVKVYLTASGRARAIRRATETQGGGTRAATGHRARGETAAVHQRLDDARETGPDAGAHREPDDDVIALTRAELDRRDQLDSNRGTSPLAKAEDALEVDTTALTAEQVVDLVVSACRSAVAVSAPPRSR